MIKPQQITTINWRKGLKNNSTALQQAQGAWTYIRQEPLIHFLAIAAIFFVVESRFAIDDRELIQVEASTQEYLLQQRSDLLLRPLSDAEKDEVLASFIEEEILVREANKRGFNSSSRIRTLLIQNMRLFLINSLPQASEEQLHTFYNENPDRFTTSEAISYEYLFFNTPEGIPANYPEHLNTQGSPPKADHALANNGTRRLHRLSQKSVAKMFGPKIAPDILSIDDDLWHGPFTSPQGQHFLRIEQHFPAYRTPYAEARQWVEAEWFEQQRRQLLDKELNSMKANYRIHIQPLVGKTL